MAHRFIYNNHAPTVAATTTTTTTVASITDYDGNVYTEVTIGSQTWLRQPLRTTHYRSGAAVTCYNPGNDVNNVPIFGKLYTWADLTGTSTASLAPTGYHVASKTEWETLLSGYTKSGDYFLGAGTKLKMTGTTAWTNATGTDNYGFSQVAAGYYNAGSYALIKSYNWTWTTTSLSASAGWIFQFNDTGANAADVYEPNGGFTKAGWYFGGIRMLKD